MERNKIFLYAGITLIFLLLAGILFFNNSNVTGGAVSITGGAVAENSELDKYRSEDIPEDCRIPEYEDDIKLWKEHLSLHKQTLYCLEYYNDAE